MMKSKKQTTYELITQRIIDSLDKGDIPWIKPWQQVKNLGMPHNFKSGLNYNGLNMFLLYSQSWSTPYFLTYRQVKEMGGNVRKGERGTPITYFNWVNIKDKKDPSKLKNVPLLKYYTVFNAEQIEGIEFPNIEDNKKRFKAEFEAIEGADDLLKIMSKRIVKGSLVMPKINHIAQNRAYYRPSTDQITMPTKEQFKSSAEYYSVLFHELTHSTGHKDKLNRSTLVNAHFFGDKDYSKEELCAEMGAAFLCGLSDIDMHTIRNSQAYIKNWLKALKGNSQLVIQAASAAQKAVDFLIGEYKEENKALKEQKGE